MKRLLGSMLTSRNKKIACTVSAAALMLGVSSAATIGLHFQCDYYCSGSLTYTGYPVTMTAFGIESNAWENLTEMPTGYHSCGFTVPGYNFDEVIDSTTSTNGLNPLPYGSIDVSWFGNCANFDPFYGYAGSPPYYQGGGPLTNPKTGEQQVYATFIRDGVNFGPNTSGQPAPYGSADNPLMAYYYVDVTGLKTLFTNTPFVVEMIASADSMFTQTNAMVIDVDNSITNVVSWPDHAPVPNQNNTPWPRGIGGGMSTFTGVFSNVDHIHINSFPPQHGGLTSDGTGYNNGGTISGFILTDKPVVTMSPQSIPIAGPGDTIVLSAYAIGVPPLAYQWQLNGKNIPGATTLTNTLADITLADSGNYTLVVTNLYGVATSYVATVTVDSLTQIAASNIVYDSNPDNSQHNGVNSGATWLASSTAGAVTRDGVMSFVAVQTNGITVPDETAFDGPTGTFSFWMKSAGTDTNDVVTGGTGAAIFERPTSTPAAGEFVLLQFDAASGSGLEFIAPGYNNLINPTNNVSDNNWHFVALTFDQTASGGAAVFIDGTLAENGTNGNNLAYTWPTGQALEIGYDSGGYYRNYNGLLDDVRYYSSVLSASEISSIYSSGALADTADLQFQFNFTAAPEEGVVLSWLETTAVLQTAPSVDGPWTDVTGASSPYTIVPVASQQYFRYRWPHTPSTVNSNPYLM
ncbi:MAG TPA: LamG-like jellyroll fold domain-containing protein [Verrucomicrobiae bacterium]|jgi:hypothetical protein|nr:LamG-like jellyroll fold domain-containing protein [Verrucomicrobiae bacterium]